MGIVAAIAAIALLLPAPAAVGQEDAVAPAQPPDAQGPIPPGATSAESASGGASTGAPGGEPPPGAAATTPPAGFSLSLDNVAGAVDRTHESVSERLNRTAAWFDSFFGDRRTIEEGFPESHFRLRTGVRVRERSGTAVLARLHANLVMPGTRRRLRLIVEGRDKEEQAGIQPRDPTAADFDTGEDRQGSLQALYELIRRFDVNASLRAGVRFHFPVDPFLKLRLRYSRPLGTTLLVRLTQEGFVTVQEGLGETTRIDLERQFAPWTVLRWSTSGTLAESNAGFVWESGLSLLRQITRRTAVTVEGGVSGQAEPVGVMTNYVAKVRFRQNVFRPWLFYEIEPELSWPRDERGAYPPTWAGTLLVELQFGSPREAPGAGPPPSAPPSPGVQPDQHTGPR